MFRKDQPLKAFNLLACLALLLASVGCQIGSVSGPADDGKTDLSGISSAPSANPWSPAVTIGPAGGEVSNGRVTLVFPEGALDTNHDIVMRMDGRSNLVVEFGPHGLVFNRPVVMELRLEGTNRENDSENAEIMWYNPANGDWESITNLPSGDPNEARAELEHFSKYGDIGGFSMN